VWKKTFSRLGCKPFLLGLVSIALLSGCSVPALRLHAPKLSGNRAFIVYWPPDTNSNRLRLAVKDNIDMKGVVTTAGSKPLTKKGLPAEKDASCLAIARKRNVQFVGKANLSEFAVSPSGMNEYFGTPHSPLNSERQLLPGGSSCGSAVAVADGMADVAFGTDTAGSIRVPAAWCGVVGLKTTYGLVPLDGVFPVEPEHLDTVGPMAKDIAHTVMGMDLLQDGFAGLYDAAVGAKPFARDIRVGRLKLKETDPKIDRAVDEALAKAGFQVVDLNEEFRKKWENAKKDGNTVAAAGAWISEGRFRWTRGIAGRTRSVIRAGRLAYKTTYNDALRRQPEWQKTLDEIFKSVDFIVLPTMQSIPKAIPPTVITLFGYVDAATELVMLDVQNTVAVNFAGNPALAMPVPLRESDVAVASLQFIGPKRSEAQLLNAGRLVEAAVKNGVENVPAKPTAHLQ
jgi:amidase